MIKKSLITLSKPIVNPVTTAILRNYYRDSKALQSPDREAKVLVLAPHADDETIGLGGTISAYADNNCEVHCILLTNGANSNSKLEKDSLVNIRKMEMKRVQKILEIAKVEYWDLPDGQLRSNSLTTKQLKEKLTHFQPDIVYCPTFVDAHPDHLATVEILMKALAEAPFDSLKVRLYEVNCPIPKSVINCVMDVSMHFDRKVAALNEFSSQAIAFDGFIRLAQLKRHLTNEKVRTVETFLEMTADEFLHGASHLFSNQEYERFPLLFKQANRTQTLLWALFYRYKKKVSIYRRLIPH